MSEFKEVFLRASGKETQALQKKFEESEKKNKQKEIEARQLSEKREKEFWEKYKKVVDDNARYHKKYLEMLEKVEKRERELRARDEKREKELKQFYEKHRNLPAVMDANDLRKQLTDAQREKDLLVYQINESSKTIDEKNLEVNRLETELEEAQETMRTRPTTAQYRQRFEKEFKEKNQEQLQKTAELENRIKILTTQIEQEKSRQQQCKVQYMECEVKQTKLEVVEDIMIEEQADIMQDLDQIQKEGQQSERDFQQEYNQLTNQKVGSTEATKNSAAWKRTATHMLRSLASRSNPDIAEQICNILGNAVKGSSWFVYAISENNKWNLKTSRGDVQQWKAKPGFWSGVLPSGRSDLDMAIWCLLSPSESDLQCIEAIDFDEKCEKVEEILASAQKSKIESEAMRCIVTRLDAAKIPWTFVYVAPLQSTFQTRICQDRFYFTDSSNFFIDLYLGL